MTSVPGPSPVHTGLQVRRRVPACFGHLLQAQASCARRALPALLPAHARTCSEFVVPSPCLSLDWSAYHWLGREFLGAQEPSMITTGKTFLQGRCLPISPCAFPPPPGYPAARVLPSLARVETVPRPLPKQMHGSRPSRCCLPAGLSSSLFL